MRRHEIEKGIVRAGNRLVHLGHHGLILMRPGDGEHARVRGTDAVGLDAKTAGDDHLAVLGQGLADGGKGSALALSSKPQVLTTTASAPW